MRGRATPRSGSPSRFGVDPAAPIARKAAPSLLLLVAGGLIGLICLALGSMVSAPLAAAVGTGFALFVCSGLSVLWIPANWLVTVYRTLETAVVWSACACLVVLTAWLLIKTFAH